MKQDLDYKLLFVSYFGQIFVLSIFLYLFCLFFLARCQVLLIEALRLFLKLVLSIMPYNSHTSNDTLCKYFIALPKTQITKNQVFLAQQLYGSLLSQVQIPARKSLISDEFEYLSQLFCLRLTLCQQYTCVFFDALLAFVCWPIYCVYTQF